MAFHNPSDAEIRALLLRVKNIAVVGLSPKPERASYRVAQVMQQAGYRIIPVRPSASASRCRGDEHCQERHGGAGGEVRSDRRALRRPDQVEHEGAGELTEDRQQRVQQDA